MTNDDDYWYLRAACRGKHELFDAEESLSTKEHYPHIEQARDICWGRDGRVECPVRAQCRLAGRTELTGIYDGEPAGGANA